ncbi:glycosyltransferase family 2 protein [Acinetobacter seifertii]|uniref:glycosyltransferase family 2 protein n=1 Tax=Acinetobacter seifertii TaxID=1530123 RepID=UPI0024DE855D|nr:glycosyl transferase [Acinetobacter seifertii]MDV4263533.1 glycosyl transferase [Acinetobacter seifertii]
MPKVVMVVVLYNKMLRESSTLQSLLSFTHSLDHLVIVNNGPKNIILDDFFENLRDKHLKVTLENYLQNKPLSWIYNDLIEGNDADYYVLFDDDTIINAEYENHLFETLNDIDIEFPKIYARVEHIQHFPMVNNKLLTNSDELKNVESIFSVGSGLILSKNIKNIFIEKFGSVFDPHFAFYGVDSTFFIRLNNLLKQGEKFKFSCRTYLKHGLSLTEEELTDWRKKEFIYENTLKVKYYSGSVLMAKLKFIRLMYRKLSHFEFRDLKLVIQTFVKGKHPRC